jgi:ligand-binding SRPBCC domain-containing protein
MMNRVLETRTLLPGTLAEVFDFFSRAENLGKITPSTLGFEILTPLPIEMKQGALIDYKIKLYGLPMRWRTEITAWEPPYRFVDTQLKGPYALWVHEHTFSQTPEGVEMIDRVEYRVPAGPFEPIVHQLFVGPSLRHIFGHREKAIREQLAAA